MSKKKHIHISIKCYNKNEFSKTISSDYFCKLHFIFIKPLTMRLCTLCKIVSMSKQYSGTVGLKTKINLATRYIIKGSFKQSQSETERHFFRHFCCVANLSFFTGKPEL